MASMTYELSGVSPRAESFVAALLALRLGAETIAEEWLRLFFPGYVRAPFAAHHLALWEWVWGLALGVRPRPFVGVWPRGGAKSTSAELACVAVGARRSRRYGLYVCATQDRAEDHVANVATMLASPQLERFYPDLCRRALRPDGVSRGWRANRLHTASGLVLDALGLDRAARGVKIDEQRPDFVVIDDIDDQHDSPGVVNKKLRTLGSKILLTGAADVAVLVIQNLIHANGVVAQVVDGRAQILGDRILSGPVPALVGAFAIDAVEVADHDDPEVRPWRIRGGEPSWDGQGIEECEQFLALVGPKNFRVECQHETGLAIEGMFADVLPDVAHCTRDEVPDLVRKAIALDPAVTDTDGSDAHGVQCDGIANNGTIYRLRSWEQRAAPGTALELAITWAYEERVDKVYIEMNVGADLSGRSIEQSWEYAFNTANERVLDRHPEWKRRKRPKPEGVRATGSTGSKAERAQRMHTDYEANNKIVHVLGDHLVLEAALARFPEVKPFDLVDAAYYSWRVLRRRRKAGGLSPVQVERQALPGGIGPSPLGTYR